MSSQHMTIDQAIKLGMQHHQAGQFAQAESIYRQILAAQPNHAEALHLLGLIAQQANRPDTAAELISRAIAINPNAVHYQANYAQCLASLGRQDEAIAIFRRVITLQPYLAEAHFNLGNLLQSMDRIEEAIASFRQALRSRPGYVEALNNLGNCLREVGQADEAILLLRRATELQPGLVEAHLNLGIALFEHRDFDAAIESFHRTLQLRADHPDALNGLGNALYEKGDIQGGIEQYQRVLKVAPQHSSAMSNLARTFSERGEPQAAIEVYRRALQASPDNPAIHYNLGIALIEQGDLLQGFREYEYRWKARQLGLSLRWIESPLWDGSDLAGRDILLLAEQGFGDAIQFARYIPLVASRGGRILLRCKPELAAIFKDIDGVEKIILPGEELPKVAAHCPLMSLPRAFGTTIDTIPTTVPYLPVDPHRAATWQDRVASLGNGMKVGLVWAGSSTQANDRMRSATLEAFAPLGEVGGLHFISLQKGKPAQQVPSGLNLVDWTEELRDFAETAALIDQLDLVVGVDTAVAHLSGALGQRTLVALSTRADWRWMRERADSPWYPTMKLFRQRVAGQWDEPIMRIREELMALKASLGNG